jgi:hypothetical protein
MHTPSAATDTYHDDDDDKPRFETIRERRGCLLAASEGDRGARLRCGCRAVLGHGVRGGAAWHFSRLFLAIGEVPSIAQLLGFAIVLIGFRLTQKG